MLMSSICVACVVGVFWRHGVGVLKSSPPGHRKPIAVRHGWAVCIAVTESEIV